MVFNQDAEGRFSAIAASFNNRFERDARRKAGSAPLNLNVGGFYEAVENRARTYNWPCDCSHTDRCRRHH